MTENLTLCFHLDLLCALLLFVLSAAVCESCVPGFYGRNCSKACQLECKDGLCGASGLCESCRDGFYGIPCDKRCPSTCPDNLCHRYNVSCKKECREGMYGKKCDKQCPRCPGPCHWRTGDCVGISSEKTDLSSVHYQSQPESHAASDGHSVSDFTFPLAIGISVTVAIPLAVVLVCLIRKRRRLTADRKGFEKYDVSSQPLLTI